MLQQLLTQAAYARRRRLPPVDQGVRAAGIFVSYGPRKLIDPAQADREWIPPSPEEIACRLPRTPRAPRKPVAPDEPVRAASLGELDAASDTLLDTYGSQALDALLATAERTAAAERAASAPPAPARARGRLPR